MRLGGAGTLLASGLVACTLPPSSTSGGGPPVPASDIGSPSAALSVLTGDGRLVSLDLRTGALLSVTDVLWDDAPATYPGQHLAPLAGSVFLLAPTGTSAAVVDPRTGAARPVAVAGARYLAVVGNARGDGVHLVGVTPDSLVLGAWSAATGLRGAGRAPLRDRRAWVPLGLWVDPGERQVVVSYHGANTSGADWFTVAPDGLRRCPGLPRFPEEGCLTGHGFVAASDGTLHLASGTPLVLAYDGTWSLRGALDSGLHGHVMGVAVDPRSGTVAAVAPCGDGGGLSILRPRSGAVAGPPTELAARLSIPQLAAERTVVSRLSPESGGTGQQLCGDRLVFDAEGRIAVARAAGATRLAGWSHAVLMVDARGDRLAWIRSLDAAPLDLVTVGLAAVAPASDE